MESSVTVQKVFGGVSAELVLRYLRAAPGATPAPEASAAPNGKVDRSKRDHPVEPDTVTGPDWWCTVRPTAPRRHASLEIRQVELTVTGEEGAVTAVMDYLMPLVLRGGA
jgi:hypothetical protein